LLLHKKWDTQKTANRVKSFSSFTGATLNSLPFCQD